MSNSGTTVETSRASQTARLQYSPQAHLAPGQQTKPKRRRRFSAEYKLQILQQADSCTQRGQISALLNREGLYSSHLTLWRKQRDRGQVQALTDNCRGRKPQNPDPLVVENQKLRQENRQLAKRLKQAETLLDIQKKSSRLLGITLSAIKSES